MSENTTITEIGPTSAIVSLFSLIVSFFGSTHIWLQNLTLIVSLLAGTIAIIAAIIKLIVWTKKQFQ
jgi:hypothetical protein